MKFDCENEPEQLDQCYVNCNKDLWSCMSNCPCMENCPDGCQNCDNEICPCSDDGDYQICSEYFEQLFWTCAQACDHDELCFSQCNREYSENLTKCPCQSGCPNGEL